MKHLITLTLTTLCLTTANANSVCYNDTIVKVVRPDSVVLMQTDSTTHVSVYGKNGDSSYRFDYDRATTENTYTMLNEHSSKWNFSIPFTKSEKNPQRKYNLVGVNSTHIGVSLPLQKTADMRSHVGLNMGIDIIGVKMVLPSRNDWFYIGPGLEANCFKQRDRLLWGKQNGGLITLSTPENASHCKSWLCDLALTFPIGYTHTFRTTQIGFSVIPEYHFKSFIYNKYKLNNKSVTDRFRGVDTRKFGMSFRLDYSWRDACGFYLQYSPYKRYNTPNSPNFNMLSFGIIL